MNSVRLMKCALILMMVGMPAQTVGATPADATLQRAAGDGKRHPRRPARRFRARRRSLGRAFDRQPGLRNESAREEHPALPVRRSFRIPEEARAELDPVNREKSSADFLSDPDVHKKIDDLFVGQGTTEERPGPRTFVLHGTLLKHNLKHEYYVGGDGGQDWGTWRYLLYARFLPGLWRK